MLKTLEIKNLATIDRLELTFEQGFSVLTGETGAGKSIVIGGIRLVLGEKSSTDVIRTGEAETSVAAVFSPISSWGPSAAVEPALENEVFLQRRIQAKGPGRGYLNGTLVPIKKLKDKGDRFADIYGQNDHVFLRKNEYQRDYLDQFSGSVELRREVTELAHLLRTWIHEQKALTREEQERERRLDYLSFQIREIEDAALSPQEEEQIREERAFLLHAEKLSQYVDEALEIASGRDDSLIPRISRFHMLVQYLRQIDETSSAKEMDSSLESFTIVLKEFIDYLIRAREKKENAGEKLEKLESRLSLIENLKRKYGPDIPSVLQALDQAKAEQQRLLSNQSQQHDLQTKLRDGMALYRQKTAELSQLRKRSAARLEKKLEKEISRLGMSQAQVKVHIRSEIPDLGSIKDSGIDEIEFLISPNPGEEPKPLRSIASGGELSRLMLALKTIGGTSDTGKTYVFDEIDSGIGGKTAEFVARKLRDLARKNQVICITHLPQIASYATHHFRIEKSITQGRTYTTVTKLSLPQRIEEIARLLTGSHQTETSLKNAREMLERNLSPLNNQL